MENYLKDSNETRNLEQKVYELDIQRYKLILRGYKEKVEDLIQSQEDLEKQNLDAAEEVKILQERLEDSEGLRKKASKDLDELKKERTRGEETFLKEIKGLQDEIKSLKAENKNLKNANLETLEKSKGESSKEVKSLRNELKDLKKKIKDEESDTIKDLKAKVKELTTALENVERLEQKKEGDFKEKCKSLEKEMKKLVQESKKKEEDWFKQIISQNQALLEKEDKLNVISKEITMLGKALKKQEPKENDIEILKVVVKEAIEASLTGGNDLKDKTIRTLKASNELKSKIIKKQGEKISKRKKDSHSSEESIIKPEDEETSVVFGIEKGKDTIASQQKAEPDKKKTKTNSFDEAVLKSSKNKKEGKKPMAVKKDPPVIKKVLPVVKKTLLPSDAPKLNNASFFANITFTDSSPVIKRDPNKKK